MTMAVCDKELKDAMTDLLKSICDRIDTLINVQQKPKYKTYNDLVWQDHNLAKEAKAHKDCFANWLYKDSKDAKHAIMHFDNDFGISVIKDCPFLTGNAAYECAVLQWHDGKYDLIYPSFAPDVVRLDTPHEINDLMRKIQDLPKCADRVVLENIKDTK